MLETAICVLCGYLVGTINPAWLIARLKRVDLQRKGTGNLGATNASMFLGKRVGVVILLFDVGKTFTAIKLAAVIFPDLAMAGVLTGSATIIGHVFPYYLGFKGGKGLACLGGLVLGLDWRMALPLLAIGIVGSLIANYACAVPFTAAPLFPVLYGIRTQSMAGFLILSVPAACVVMKHMENIRRIKAGEELTVREYLKGKTHS